MLQGDEDISPSRPETFMTTRLVATLLFTSVQRSSARDLRARYRLAFFMKSGRIDGFELAPVLFSWPIELSVAIPTVNGGKRQNGQARKSNFD